MIRHIEFCLQEIECEIEADQTQSLTEATRHALQRHIAGMRALLAEWQTLDDTIAAGDRLTLIRGIDPSTARLLAEKGVTRFQTIADWRRRDILALASTGLTIHRIASENWIEQAAILATGGLTGYAKALSLARIASIEDIDPRMADRAVAQQPQIEAVGSSDLRLAPIAAIAAALAEPDTAAPTATAAVEPSENIVELSPTRRTGIARRVAHAAAVLALMTTIGALHDWKLPSLTAFGAAVAANLHTR